MSIKYSKLQSVQGGPFSNTARMVDFTISEGMGQVNLAQTYVDMLVNLSNVDDDRIVNYIIRHTDSMCGVMNVDLVRNCFMTGDKVPQLENIKRVNILQRNLKELKMGTMEKMSIVDSLYSVKPFADDYMYSPFLEVHKTGSVPSFYKDNFHLRLSLSDLFGLGIATVVDTDKTGSIRLHFELENLNKIGKFIEPLLREEETILNNRKFEDIAPGDLLNVIVSPAGQYESVSNYPYFVGQHLDVSYIPEYDGEPLPADAIEDATITSIVFDSAKGQVTITLDKPFPAFQEGVTDLFTDITVGEKFFDIANVELQILTCELVVATYTQPQKSPDNISFLTWTTEEYSAGSNSVFLNKIFDVEPNAVNCMLMFNNDLLSNPISTNVHLDTYRCRVNNLDVYDRDISVNQLTGKEVKHHLTHDSLHYDSLNRTFMNANIPLRNAGMMAMVQYSPLVPYTNEARFTNDAEVGDANRIMIVSAPLPLTTDNKKFQVNLTNKAGHTIDDVILFKQVVKTINF